MYLGRHGEEAALGPRETHVPMKLRRASQRWQGTETQGKVILPGYRPSPRVHQSWRQSPASAAHWHACARNQMGDIVSSTESTCVMTGTISIGVAKVGMATPTQCATALRDDSPFTTLTIWSAYAFALRLEAVHARQARWLNVARHDSQRLLDASTKLAVPRQSKIKRADVRRSGVRTVQP